MKTFLVVAALVATSTMAFAQNKPPRSAYPEARKLYNALGNPLSRALLWEKTTQPQRLEAVKVATDLRDRTTKLWGDFSQCTHAAEFNLTFVTNINQIAFTSQINGDLRPRDMLLALREAEEFGNHRAACYSEVEELDIPSKR